MPSSVSSSPPSPMTVSSSFRCACPYMRGSCGRRAGRRGCGWLCEPRSGERAHGKWRRTRGPGEPQVAASGVPVCDRSFRRRYCESQSRSAAVGRSRLEAQSPHPVARQGPAAWRAQMRRPHRGIRSRPRGWPSGAATASRDAPGTAPTGPTSHPRRIASAVEPIRATASASSPSAIGREMMRLQRSSVPTRGRMPSSPANTGWRCTGGL